jgi:GntP family gluconate:H+ symporter
MDIYWGAVPFVVIQVLMVAIVIAFPGIVTSHVSKAAGAISGSGADELRRQLEQPAGPAAAPKEGGADKDDAAAQIERMLKQAK